MAVSRRPKRIEPRPTRFYADALSEAERADLPLALQVEGVDEEIALLRLRLRSAIEAHPEDLALMLRGIDLLARTVAKRYHLPKDSQANLTAALTNSFELMREIHEEGTPSG